MKYCFGILFYFLITTGAFAQDQGTVATGSSKMSFSSISPNPFQHTFTFRTEAQGKIVVFNAEGARIEERYFLKNEVIEMGADWPKGSYQIKVFGIDRTDFTRVKKE